LHATSTPEVPSIYIHPFPSPEPPKNILLLTRERITKNISVFPYKINAQVILLLPLAILSQEMSALKKEKYEEIKRGKCPEPRKKRKSKMRGKNGQVSDSRIRDMRYPPERKEKKKSISVSSQKFQKARKVYIPSKSKSRIRLSPLLSPYTIHSPHMHILIKLIDLLLWIHGLTIQ